ncbi:leukocyte surface antigen CD47 isoform X6 [Oxyura jamaicensis]|uniref:leukocyte surface antigen CD47 isoform X6 n=1 Tax=Oxyura jamaicensis TaxID=8884 RepID=UPI0015A6D62B|nr:leukocyte surface antigen CD47 isoform X6 [Oxyura jamaicensis]
MGLPAACPLLLLLGALRYGSAQLVFSTVDFVERDACNTTVVLPCHVINLKEHNDSNMFVSWKKQGRVLFSFNGAEQRIYRHEMVPSANLLSQQDLSKGIASLKLKSSEAEDGNYSCEVTELNREGETKVDLRTVTGRQFDFMESVVISVLLFLIVIIYWAQLGVIALKCETVHKNKTYVAVGCAIFTVLAVIAVVLFVQGGNITISKVGLGFVVLPAVILMVLQYYIFKIVLVDVTRKGYVLIGLQFFGFIIALVGFALCISACPPELLSVVIAGLAVMAVEDLLALLYMYTSCSRMKDHQTPRKAVEEPLNDAKGVMLE